METLADVRAMVEQAEGPEARSELAQIIPSQVLEYLGLVWNASPHGGSLSCLQLVKREGNDFRLSSTPSDGLPVSPSVGAGTG